VTGAALAPGAILLHIGPHKTGTTSVQSAFHGARSTLRRRGIHYAGADRHPVMAAQAAIEEPGPGQPRQYRIARWKALLSEIERHRSDLVVLSSEWFADAEPAAIRRIVDELGRDRVHVVLTLRPLVRLLPSQWQQYVAAGSTIGYEPWLESIFGPPEGVATPSFWHRHRHDQLVARWAAEVGPDRVTVVVVDEIDRRGILAAFEALTGLAVGSLVAEADRANRSLTAPEAELLLAVNARLAAEIRDANLRLNLGLYGVAAALRLREPGTNEPRIETPPWAIDRAAAVQHEIVGGIERAGVRVVGDLRALDEPPTRGTRSSRRAGGPKRTEIEIDWPDIVAAAAFGALMATGLARTRRDARARLQPLSNERLMRVVAQRVRDFARNGLRTVRRMDRNGFLSARHFALGFWTAPSPEVEAALAAFGAVLRERRLSGRAYDSVTYEGVIPELQRLEAGPTPDAISSWPQIGAAFVIGIVRASGLLPAAGSAYLRLPPPRAGVETVEVAAVSTPAVAAELVRRVIAGVLPGTSGQPT
jgi:hypothetical protein